MAYTTGTSASVDDFLGKLVDFAVTNAGFTNQGQATSSSASGSRTAYRVSKGSVHWFFMRLTNNFGFQSRMSYTAFPTLGNPDSPGTSFQTYPTQCATWALSAPWVGHYFFTDGTCVHAVIEVSAGIFNHFSFGSVTKWGDWPGGEYVTGGYFSSLSAPNYRDWNSSANSRPFNDLNQGTSLTSIFSYLRATNTGTGSTDFKPLNGGYAGSCGMFLGILGSQDGEGCFYTQVMRDAPSAFTARTPIFPGLVRRYDFEQNSGLSALAGIVPYVGFLKMTQDMNVKDLIETDWQIFPITMRTGGDTTIASNSGEYALAYKRV